jgi:RNA polymerase sigma-70 factor (ECF subfamily)
VTATSGEQADSELIARWRRGDQRAATLLVERHARGVARFVCSLGVTGEVDEIVQDTFVRAFGSLAAFRGESSLPTWLFTIARNLVRDRARARRRERQMVPIEEEHATTENTALDGAIADEAQARLVRALETLTAMQRQVFTLRVSEGMAYRDIARVLGSTEGAARVHYHNAVRAIKEKLDD